MKYFIPMIILSLVLLSCAKEEVETDTTTTELEGTWVESCHDDDSYYRINSLTVSGTN